jgi:hypothetical protein
MTAIRPSDRWGADALPDGLRCPLCGNPLSRDTLWTSPHWLCPAGHSYSSPRVLLAELQERGWLPAGVRPSGAVGPE